MTDDLWRPIRGRPAHIGPKFSSQKLRHDWQKTLIRDITASRPMNRWSTAKDKPTQAEFTPLASNPVQVNKSEFRRSDRWKSVGEQADRSPDFSRKTSRPSPGQTWELLVKAGCSLKRRRWFSVSWVPALSESWVVGRSFETSFTLLRFEVHLHPASADVEQNWERLADQQFSRTTTAGLKLQAPWKAMLSVFWTLMAGDLAVKKAHKILVSGEVYMLCLTHQTAEGQSSSSVLANSGATRLNM